MGRRKRERREARQLRIARPRDDHPVSVVALLSTPAPIFESPALASFLKDQTIWNVAGRGINNNVHALDATNNT